MKNTKDIQLRYHVLPGEDLRTFIHEGIEFEILGASINVDLITRYSPLHKCLQYKASGSDNKIYEVYVYYYTRFEGGSFAVVDAIREQIIYDKGEENHAA
jgi:hypothetical protein